MVRQLWEGPEEQRSVGIGIGLIFQQHNPHSQPLTATPASRETGRLTASGLFFCASESEGMVDGRGASANLRTLKPRDRIGVGKFLILGFSTNFPPTYRRLLAHHSAPAPAMRMSAWVDGSGTAPAGMGVLATLS